MNSDQHLKPVGGHSESLPWQHMSKLRSSVIVPLFCSFIEIVNIIYTVKLISWLVYGNTFSVANMRRYTKQAWPSVKI